ncbi:MAG: hypothetical protein KIT31_05495 [Deltaproteobacteria bacterium]|nr:hypothetical protein [Deltaproteobacteria bacterium]
MSEAQLLLKMKADEIQSPIRYLVPHLPKVVVMIAPERVREAIPIIAGLTLHVTNEATWVLCITPEDGVITVSRRALEILWCVSYAHFVVYTRIAGGKVASGGADVVLDLTNDQELRDAAGLLQWAIEAFVSPPGTVGELPLNLPRPLEAPPKGSNANVADELALCAMGFFLFHEIGHSELEHHDTVERPAKPDPKRWRRKERTDPNASSVAQERDADYFAGDWILAQLELDDPKFVKRALAATVGLTILVARTIHIDAHGGQTHPRPYDRLFHFLDRYLSSDVWHVVWAFAVATLKLHFDNSTIVLSSPDGGHVDFRSALDAYVDVLANRDVPAPNDGRPA